jgi:hypothetical protein
MGLADIGKNFRDMFAPKSEQSQEKETEQKPEAAQTPAAAQQSAAAQAQTPAPAQKRRVNPAPAPAAAQRSAAAQAPAPAQQPAAPAQQPTAVQQPTVNELCRVLDFGSNYLLSSSHSMEGVYPTVLIKGFDGEDIEALNTVIIEVTPECGVALAPHLVARIRDVRPDAPRLCDPLSKISGGMHGYLSVRLFLVDNTKRALFIDNDGKTIGLSKYSSCCDIVADCKELFGRVELTGAVNGEVRRLGFGNFIAKNRSNNQTVITKTTVSQTVIEGSVSLVDNGGEANEIIVTVTMLFDGTFDSVKTTYRGYGEVRLIHCDL